MLQGAAIPRQVHRRWALVTAGLVAVAITGTGGCLVDFTGPGGPSGDAAPTCGNGYIEMGEECDGENLAGRTCADLGFESGTISCREDCLLDQYECEGGCGNNRMEGLEECDDGLGNSDSVADACRTNCVLPRCGDDVADNGELCDGADLKGLSCESMNLGSGTVVCQPDCGGFDISGCDGGGDCGNGVIDDPSEVCDGGDVGGETCTSLGYYSGTLTCLPDCSDYDVGLCLQQTGQPCTEDAQCQGGVCHREDINGYPGGMCSAVCSPGAIECSDGICVSMYDTEYFCMTPCLTSLDCRQGYACFNPWYGPEAFCFPRCESDSECIGTGTCNLYDGHCNTNDQGGDTGAACSTESACKSNVCWYDPVNGYCVTLCKVSTGICPGDGLCANAFAGTMGDMGMCLDGCQAAGDCSRPAYDCTNDPYGSAETVCMD